MEYYELAADVSLMIVYAGWILLTVGYFALGEKWGGGGGRGREKEDEGKG